MKKVSFMLLLLIISLSNVILADNEKQNSSEFEKAEDLYTNEKYKAAQPIFEKIAISKSEESAKANYYLAEIAYYTIEDEKERNNQHEKYLLLAIDGGYIEIADHLFDTYVEDKSIDKADKLIIKLMSKYPNDVYLNNEIARYYYMTNQFSKAIIQYEKLLKLGDSDSFTNLAYIYYETKDYDKAAKFILENKSKISNSSMMLGMIYEEQKKYDLAEKYYKEYFDESPYDEWSHELINVYAKQKKYSKMEEYLNSSKTLVEVDINDIISNYLFENNDYEMAIKYANKSIDKDPKNYYAYILLACSYEELKDYDKAEKAFEIASAKDYYRINYVSFMVDNGYVN